MNVDRSTIEILPDSRSKSKKDQRWVAAHWDRGFYLPGHFEEKVYCNMCSAFGGWVPTENISFVQYMCNDCFPKYGHLTVQSWMPDQVFFKEVELAQIEKYGRVLTAQETEVQLADPESLESVLVRSREALTPKAGA